MMDFLFSDNACSPDIQIKWTYSSVRHTAALNMTLAAWLWSVDDATEPNERQA